MERDNGGSAENVYRLIVLDVHRAFEIRLSVVFYPFATDVKPGVRSKLDRRRVREVGHVSFPLYRLAD